MIEKPTDAELTELAEWLRAVPDALLSDVSPHAKYFERAAQILESLRGQRANDPTRDDTSSDLDIELPKARPMGQS